MHAHTQVAKLLKKVVGLSLTTPQFFMHGFIEKKKMGNAPIAHVHSKLILYKLPTTTVLEKV